ncbi:MAG: pyridoxal 5'-phosphate synthase glutaminase subunit PdxT [Anaerolineaceae bacterium]|jgi:5'-phosphate synthase pdxT subunit
MKIGVLALQGDFAEHQSVLVSLGADVVQVRLPEHLAGLNGLIIPGGESTTMGKLAEDYNLMQPLRQFGREHAIWGTCAGAILLAKEVGRRQPLLGLMDITISRNAFGRQVDSFEANLAVPALLTVDPEDRTFHTVFIRAPIIETVGKGVEVLSALEDGRIVAVRQGHLLATSFHPELTGDDRFHRYFMELSK